jgi:glycine/D-amino acid oxidase-like deaminating enzyme
VPDVDVEAVATQLLASGAKLLPALAAVRLEDCRTTMGMRPMPADGLPLLGWAPGLGGGGGHDGGGGGGEGEGVVWRPLCPFGRPL